MTRLRRSYAIVLRSAAAAQLGDLIDELEPGRLPAAVPATHHTFLALDGALRGASRWARHVIVPATPEQLVQVGASSAHLQPVTR